MDVGGNRYTTVSTAGPLFVTEKDGKILRVEPMEFEPEEVDSWELKKNGMTYRPPLVQGILPWGLDYKEITYTENRVKYPMKRVDWDPDGDRNPQNRGISGYERISWDEAFDIIEKEMRRVIDTYGPSALGASNASHCEWGGIHYYFSEWYRFWHAVGSTHMDTSPISWEGWAAGGPFIWGFWPAFGYLPGKDVLQDIDANSELLILWSNEILFHSVYTGLDNARVWQHWRELGKRVIVIDPLSNETAQMLGDRWIPIKPGTDGALALAVMHTWIVEDTYDKKFIANNTIGFTEDSLPEGAPAGCSMMSYIMGDEDGVEKTPEWAAEITGVPAREIVGLAREWASKPATVWCEAGGACRREFAHELSRLQATMMAMQGVGRPGVNALTCAMTLCGPYDADNHVGPAGYADGGISSLLTAEPYRPNPVKQAITVQKMLECMENDYEKDGPVKWNGGRLHNISADEWWAPYEYPMPGCSEVHLMWQRGSSWGNHPDRNSHTKALRSPKLECIIVNNPTFDRDCHMADLVLPVTTLLERADFSEPGSVGKFMSAANINLRSAVMSAKVLEPAGESKTDLEIMSEMAYRLGFGEYYDGGNSEEDFIQKLYATTNIPMTYDEFKDKGYYVWPAPEDYSPKRPMNVFYNDPKAMPMMTPTGKIEIFSTAIFEHYGMNPEIPPVPHFIPEREGVLGGEIYKKYPLQVTMAHPRFRFHSKYDNCKWLQEQYKFFGEDGYAYEPMWMHPADAKARNLAEGDIVYVYNDRGKVMSALHITERVMPGTIWQTYGAWEDPLDPTEEKPIDRSGNMNTISNPAPMSVHHVAGGYNSTLVEVEKADLDALAKAYPEGMAGKHSTWNREG